MSIVKNDGRLAFDLVQRVWREHFLQMLVLHVAVVAGGAAGVDRGVVAAGAGLSAVPWWQGMQPPAWTQGLAALGLATLAVLAGWLLRTAYTPGGLAGLVSGWPRESHPVVPPCCALKAVPESSAWRARLALLGSLLVMALGVYWTAERGFSWFEAWWRASS